MPGFGPGRGIRGGPLPKQHGPQGRSMASETARRTATFVFMTWKHKRTLTPRLVNNVERKLTGAIFHLYRQ